MERTLRLAALILCSSLATAVWAQEKNVTVQSQATPFVSLQEKQQQAQSGTAAMPAARNPLPDLHYAARQTLPGVVHILCTYKPDIKNIPRSDQKLRSEDLWNTAAGSPVGSASGVLLSDNGYIVTNYHVVKDTRSLDAVLYDHRIYRASLVGVDSLTDLAILKIDEEGLPFVKLGRTDSLEEGDWVLAVGNPLNLPFTVTAGIISARKRFIRNPDGKPGMYPYIQTDAVTNNGSSGGAVVNMNGELIGLSTGIFTRDGSYNGYSFCLPAEVITRIGNDLIRYGVHRPADLGVQLQEMPNVQGAYVNGLAQDGAGMLAGIHKGDVITAVAGQPVITVETFNNAMLLQYPGKQVMITIMRNGKALQLPAVPLENGHTTAFNR
ncbi:MAG TPA: trypsin-like peptidase domain-containing protein [Chitinophaga sp.]|uniref:S1C family serine protease n=1 Tax=Chitinophaga sp. TaxID=1869181 RepID=UPI002DB9607D|nr:trypsin-like peptidase domain-containing protein [Chitinophaga sp.]HEU4556172.1 trypsin-like peptidase domain-containing protein [Chitinophaga sp.]